jgi:cytochrome o ubiquinol oxidase subunit 2
VFALLFFFAWKYRASSPQTRAGHSPNWDHDNYLAEFAWWLVPTVIIAVLGVIMWRSAHALDPYQPLQSSKAPLTVDVVALDWKWLFIYPSLGIASVNVLEMPENTPVHFYLTADAPMNSFWIPSLGGQIMVMPGMQTQLNLMASREGSFNGFSANISGEGFSGMAFTAKSVSQDEFTQWAQSIEDASSTPLTPAAYAALAQPSEYNPVAYYSLTNENMYTTVIDKFMMPENSTTTPATPSMNMGMNMSGMQMGASMP